MLTAVAVSVAMLLAFGLTALAEEGPGNEQPAQKLNLTSMCSSDPDKTRNWRVSNPNTSGDPIDYRWEVVGSKETGNGTVAPGGYDYFETGTEPGGPNTTRIYVGGVEHSVKASGGAKCTSLRIQKVAPLDPNADKFRFTMPGQKDLFLGHDEEGTWADVPGGQPITITEHVGAEWDVYPICIYPGTEPGGNDIYVTRDGNSFTITVPKGVDATCIVENYKRPRVTVVKQVNRRPGTEFEFSLQELKKPVILAAEEISPASTWPHLFVSQNDGTTEHWLVNRGASYRITEEDANKNGWTLTNIVCKHDNPVVLLSMAAQSLDLTEGWIDITPLGDMTCTFTNYNPPPEQTPTPPAPIEQPTPPPAAPPADPPPADPPTPIPPPAPTAPPDLPRTGGSYVWQLTTGFGLAVAGMARLVRSRRKTRETDN